MEKSNNSSSTHINVAPSTTLNRHYVHRPSAYTNYSSDQKSTAAQLQAEALKRRQALAAEINRQNLAHLRQVRQAQAQKAQAQQAQAQKAQQAQHPKAQKATPQRLQARPTPTEQPIPPTPPVEKPVDQSAALLAQAAKNRATEAALQASALQSVATAELEPEADSKKSPSPKKFFKAPKNKGRFILALTASAACIIALGLVVKLNMPDLSVRVAAIQTGIEATYPSFLPSGYQLAGVSTGKNDSVSLDFSGEDNKSFKITEEKSSWNSNALLNNYVKEVWGTDYVVLREQGITIYVSNSDAAWVNGGILYKLSSPSADTLTKKEIQNIATSL